MQSTAKKCLNLTMVNNRSFLRNIAVNAVVSDPADEVKGKSWKEIPGPSSLPIIGQLKHFLPGGIFSNLETLQENMYKQFGPIARMDSFLGKPAFIILFDADACETILRSENSLPRRPGLQTLEYYRKEYKKPKNDPLKQTGLISDHGETWKQFRSKVNPALLQPKTIKLYSDVLEEVADDMIKRLRSKRNEDFTIQGKFDDEMNLWALESIGVVALGGRLGCLNTDLPADSPAKKLIQNIHDFFLVANKLDFRPSLWRYIATPLFKKAMKVYEEQENVSKVLIRKAMEDLKTKNSSKKEKGVLEKLLDIDEETAVIMANDMLFAGVDTTSQSMIGILYLLANNPEKQQKLREEVTSGTDKKTFLKACIKESIRLKPVVSGNMRMINKDYNLLGYKIPKGMMVVFGHQHMSLMEDHFKRSKEFLPERWFDKEAPYYYNSAHPFAYNPFGFGVRSCIGRRIAELELETFLTKLIRNYKIEWFGPPIRTQPRSLNYLVGPFNFKFIDV